MEAIARAPERSTHETRREPGQADLLAQEASAPSGAREQAAQRLLAVIDDERVGISGRERD